MGLKDYFEQRAREGSWGSLYDGAPDLRNHNFLTRRAAVFDLLESDGPFARVLDVGCGTGDYVEIASRHDGAYFGLDFSAGMICEARRRTAAAGHAAHLVVGSGERLPYRKAAFDLVLALGYIAYFHDPGLPLGEIRRVLRPGGVLIMQCAKPDLVGWIDRVVLSPLIALVRRRRRPHVEAPEGWVNVRYSGRALDALARRAGFERTDRAFNNFNVLPWFLRRRFPDRAIQLSEALTYRRPSWWRFLAVNYIGRYARRRPSGTPLP